jgi:pyruvate kinase
MTNATPQIRRTKIVATVGPACRAPGMLDKLIGAGIDVFRVNMSHASVEDLEHWVRAAREASSRAGRSVGVLADLQGPKLRTGPLVDHAPVLLQNGSTLEITTEPVQGTSARVSTAYAALPKDVKPGDRILLSDGSIELSVRKTTPTTVVCDVVHGGWLREHAGMNLPGVAVSSPSLTDKDRADLAHAVRLQVDFIALSFVRSEQDVADAKAAIAAAGGDTPVVAKIEKPEAIEHLDAILKMTDVVMVARGDLGVEMPPEKVPTLQKLIIRQAAAHLVPVITATQMLESMVHSPRPTRAEASDVANAIMDGTDATMLSEETAAGEFPVEAVATMVRIALEAEAHSPLYALRSPRVSNDSHAISHAACTIAESIDVRAIAAFTRSGFSARIVSKDRPCVPIYAFVPDESVARRLALDHGVQTCIIDFARTTDALLAAVEAELLERKVVDPGEAVVVVGGTPMGVRGRTNFLKIVRAGAG